VNCGEPACYFWWGRWFEVGGVIYEEGLGVFFGEGGGSDRLSLVWVVKEKITQTTHSNQGFRLNTKSQTQQSKTTRGSKG